MTGVDTIISARKKAEQAVADMTDGELKTKAFETILAHLLSNSVSLPQAHAQAKDVPKQLPSDQSQALELSSAPIISSSNLAELRDDIQKREKINASEGALIIAGYFERAGYSTFSSDDIEKVYRALVRGGANKLPIVKDYKSLAKDLVRSKLWFDRIGRGQFRVSDSGARVLNEMK